MTTNVTGFFKIVMLALILVFGGELAAQEMSREAVGLEVQKHFASPKPNFAFSEEIPGEGDLARLLNAFFKDNFLYVDYLSRESKDYQEGLIESACAYLETQGQKISGFAPKPKTPVTVHELKIIAARNLFPLRVSPEGKIGTLICASALGFKDYPERNVTVEAFAFQTIFNNSKLEGSFILDKVREYAELARSMKLSINSDDVIKRAQGIYWILFYQNQDFEKLLLEAYAEKAKILPFEIAAR